MDIKKIKELLDRYYDGDTTLDEEKLLKRYFIDNVDIPEELSAEKKQFEIYEKIKNADVPIRDFEKDLESLIDKQKVKYPDFNRRKTVLRITAIAASLLILFGVYSSIKHFTGRPKYHDTIEDPYLAYQETKRTLLYISEKLNYGTKELNNISIINESMQKLEPVSKLDDGLEQLKYLSKMPEPENNNNNK
jgi:hypothetical protein